MCALGVKEGVCVNGCEKGDHFIHCRQVVSKSNLYTVGKLFLRITYTLSASCTVAAENGDP